MFELIALINFNQLIIYRTCLINQIQNFNSYQP